MPFSDSAGNIVLEGAYLVERAVGAGLSLTALACVPARADWAASLGVDPSLISIAPESELAALAGYPFHRGVLARADRPASKSVAALFAPPLPVAVSAESAMASGYTTRAGNPPRIVLALPETLDPENLGSLFRNAAAFGCRAVLIGPHCPDPWSRRVLRVSMGASLVMPWARMGGPSDMDAARRAGFRTAACVLDTGATDIRNFVCPPGLVLTLGNEASGLSPAWLAECESRLTLPMSPAVDSLNVATAGAVFLYGLTAFPNPKSAVSARSMESLY